MSSVRIISIVRERRSTSLWAYENETKENGAILEASKEVIHIHEIIYTVMLVKSQNYS